MKPRPLTCGLLSLASLLSAGNISDSQQHYAGQYKSHTGIVAPDQALLNTDPEPDLIDGFVSLYNGKDLNGWRLLGGKCLFEAKGDHILGTCVKNQPSTYLCTERDDYRDYIFSAEMKWEVDGNSGIMFRAHQKGTTVAGPQVEMEGFSKDRGWSGGIYGQAVGGWRYPLWLDAHQKVRKALDREEWNRITILARGTTVQTWVNGIPAAHWTNTDFPEGFIGLQVHSGNQGTIRFRNIKVRELEPTQGIDLFASGDFRNWQRVDGQPVTKGWSIADGIIHRRSGGGSIVTKEAYTNFELRFDWKISEAGNSGVKYRTRGKLGLEYQILDDAKHRDRKDPTHRSAALYDLVAPAEDKPLQPVGAWNRGRIVAQGRTLEHWLNGSKVVSVEWGSDEWKERFAKSKYRQHEGFGSWRGPILLQDHSDPVWFRNVTIRELPTRNSAP